MIMKTLHKNLWNAAKPVLRGQFIALKMITIGKKKKFQVSILRS